MILSEVFRPLATRLLRDLSGLQITYKRVTEGAYSESTGISTPSEASSTVYAYAASPNSLRFQAGMAEQGDILVYLSAAELTFKPRPADKITYESEDWTVKNVEFVSAGSLDALYILTVHRG